MTSQTPAPAPAPAAPARKLIASYCYPPYSDVSGIVAAKRVLQAGQPVDVIANAMDSIRHKDYSLTRIGGDLVRRFAAVKSATAFSSWKSVEEYVNLGYATASRWQEEQGSYEQVYSRAQFAASHFLGARLKLAQPDLHWTAEFSDPLSHDVMGQDRVAPLQEGRLVHMLRDGMQAAGFTAPDNANLLELCEVLAFSLADEVVFTNPLQRDFMLERCHDPLLAERARGVGTVSPHPTLPREFYSLAPTTYQVPDDKVNIGYFGTFYANRGVGLLLNALAQCPSWITDAVRLHVFTSKPDDLTASAQNMGVDHCMSIGPYVDFLEFLNLADRMDVLLVNDAVTPKGGLVNPFLPSKWSDYKGSTTPVWGIIEEGSMLDSMTEIAYRTPVEHLSGIQAALAQIVTDRPHSRQNVA